MPAESTPNKLNQSIVSEDGQNASHNESDVVQRSEISSWSKAKSNDTSSNSSNKSEQQETEQTETIQYFQMKVNLLQKELVNYQIKVNELQENLNKKQLQIDELLKLNIHYQKNSNSFPFVGGSHKGIVDPNMGDYLYTLEVSCIFNLYLIFFVVIIFFLFVIDRWK